MQFGTRADALKAAVAADPKNKVFKEKYDALVANILTDKLKPKT